MTTPILTITQSSPDFCAFTLSSSTLPFANALRRVLLAEVPLMAIDEVMIFENNGVMIDEQLSHRLGLLPLSSEFSSRFVTANECNCLKGCGKCQVLFELVFTNNTNQTALVTAAHLTNRSASDPVALEQNEYVKTVNPIVFDKPSSSGSIPETNIVLTKLSPQQTIQLLCKARKGIGKTHSKWMASAPATMAHHAVITLNKISLSSLERTKQQEIIDSCPTKVYKYDESQSVIDIEDVSRCTLCNNCVEKANKLGQPEAISVDTDPTIFHFTIESTGAIPAPHILQMALETLKTKFLHAKI
jgi:DNA-directed RNA polymerase II subunit RPB3